MATLVSPGVDVSIIDESFYGSAGAGTIPLIVFATSANKASPSGTGYAPYTAPAYADKVYLATSQRDLIQNYGNPHFLSLEGTQVHGSEVNEYGLHAAYQYLGISNRAYVLRADIDLAQLVPSVSAPSSPPTPGTYWLDLSQTIWGVFRSNGNIVAGTAWESQKVLVAQAANCVVNNSVYTPSPSFGVDGAYAVVVASHDNKLYEKITGTWYAVGSSAWNSAKQTKVSGSTSPTNVTVGGGTSIIINGITITWATGTGTAANVVTDVNSANVPNITASIVGGAVTIKHNLGGNITIANNTGTSLTNLGITAGTYKGNTVVRTNNAQYPAGSVAGDIWVKGTTPNVGANWIVKYYSASTNSFVTLTAPFYPYSSTLNDGNVNKDLAAFAGLGTPTAGNVYVGYDTTTGAQVIRRWDGTQWSDLIYEASGVAPSNAPLEGTLWYNADFQIDVMVGNGENWNGYRRRYPSTDPEGVIISGSAPSAQSDGTALVDYDLWVDSSDLENYPALYRYKTSTGRWALVDKTDQTTPFGVVFYDARQDSGTTFTGIPNANGYTFNSTDMSDLLESDYVDPDAPDARTHPDGMLLFNTRFSTYNVKQWLPNYFNEGGYDKNTDYTQTTYTDSGHTYTFAPLASAGRWVTASGNTYDGSPYMGRKAQRVMVTRAMAAAITSNSDIRSEIIYYNLMAAPGYPELISDFQSLNVDQKEVAFIVADTPCRLPPTGTALQNWATNAAGAPTDGEDGLTSAYAYCAVYYPWGMSTNIDGSNVMVPPSTMALLTYAYNDQVAYQWFAPAGYRRGIVSNASSVGYLTSEGEFKTVFLNQGQRDVLYLNKINPIAYIPGRGIVVYGQKTLYALDSALDRVNVARLTNYLKYRLDNLMKPFLFEQNDQQTRDSAKLVTERFLSGLVSLRALEDFAVLCDETNNTPTRRDNNELWVDILIKPIKAIEFIYVPVRILSSDSTLDFSSIVPNN